MTVMPLHPLLREFFRSLIDLRNLVTLAKQIRWQLFEPQLFIRGGEISPERLGKALTAGTAASLASLLATLPDMGVLPPDQVNPEPQLFSWLTRKVHRLGRDPLGIGLVLDYLWSCFIEARNLSLMIHGQDLERETLAAELIQ
jgi:vacuolar-type H+-ATPase subunit C/Vma6